MDYGEAIEVLEQSNEKFEFPVEWGVDLQSEHERYLTEKYAKKPVTSMNYPKAIKAFYTRLNDDDRTEAAMDELAPEIGEIIDGSQREEQLDVLDQSMAERGIDKEHYTWYRDLRRYGTASSAPSPTSPASPTSATPSPSRERSATHDIAAPASRPGGGGVLFGVNSRKLISSSMRWRSGLMGFSAKPRWQAKAVTTQR